MARLIAAVIVSALAAPATCGQATPGDANSAAVLASVQCGAGTVLSGNQCVIPATCGAGTALVGSECLPADEAPDPLVGAWLGPQHTDNYGSGYYQTWLPVCDFMPTHTMNGNCASATVPAGTFWHRIGQDRYVFGATMWVQATFSTDGKSVHLIVDTADGQKPNGRAQTTFDLVRTEVLASP